jgi:hypothetical protein
MHKYPRTQHLEGSRLQPGDNDLTAVPFRAIQGKYLVCEEKIDGANCGISFDDAGRLLLQSRGHFLTGGPREKHFNLFKQWAHTQAEALRAVLASRFVLYGEWLYAKHTIFYDWLPHYFLEFDILDTHTGDFLDTPRRQAMLRCLPIASVPLLQCGTARTLDALVELIGASVHKSPSWRERLAAVVCERGLDSDRVSKETDPSDLMEGIYIKVEEGGRVVARYKYIRANFLTCVVDSGTHWLQRPIVPNQLKPGVDLFAAGLALSTESP